MVKMVSLAPPAVAGALLGASPSALAATFLLLAPVGGGADAPALAPFKPCARVVTMRAAERDLVRGLAAWFVKLF